MDAEERHGCVQFGGATLIERRYRAVTRLLRPIGLAVAQDMVEGGWRVAEPV